DGGAGDEDLAGLGNADPRARRRLADRLGSHVVVRMEHADAAGFGLAVHLLEVETDGAEEPEQLRPERRTARVGVADLRQPQAIAERTEGQQMRDCREQAQAQADGLTPDPAL